MTDTIPTRSEEVGVNTKRRQCATLAALAMAAAAATAQPTPGGNPYPWDDRPPKCKMPGAEAFSACAVKPWRNAALSQQRIEGLVQAGNWPLVERALTELATSGQQFPDELSHAELVVRVMDRLAAGGPSALAPESFLASWRAAVPDSKFVALMQANQTHHRAWANRGGGGADTVSPEAWELFRRGVQDAQRQLAAVPEPIRSTPVWHEYALRFALDGDGKPDPREVFMAAVQRWPAEAMLYRRMAYRLVPKWGGSWETVDTFIRGATQMLEPTEGQSTYARLYVAVERDNPEEMTSADWKRVRQGFEDWIARHPWMRPQNLYASYACRARDKEAFTRALALMPRENVRDDIWLKGYSFEACSKWAVSEGEQPSEAGSIGDQAASAPEPWTAGLVGRAGLEPATKGL